MADGQHQEQENHFERQLTENCVEYYLLVLGENATSRNQLARLETIRQAALQLCQSVAKDYIWQRDEFNLELKTEQGLTFLYGVTDYGDSVEDEWLIVYLLRQLTQSHPDLWIRVADEDGEFLLIEAANVLPKWLSPEIDRHRAWIHEDKLLLIPYDKEAPERSPSNLSMVDAVQILKSRPNALVHSAFVETEAFYRLEKYPGHINDSMHHSLLTIPRSLAHILHTLPKAVAPAVEAFYLRDAISLKPILSSTLPLKFPISDLVTVSVRFSKVLFAQLRSQRFDAPPRWQQALRKMQDTASETPDKDASRLEIGMKLTCGFEMLAKSAEKSKRRVVREVAIMLDDLQEDGEEALPRDEDIKIWPENGRDDSESWMDINYQDFEQELEGRRQNKSKGSKGGFGDDRTQADLRKIVARFEAFLNDDTAGLDGAELDDMDVDDDTDDHEDESSEDEDYEDKEVSFDEEEFSRMMREMMGFPPTDPKRAANPKAPSTKEAERSAADDNAEIQELTAQMEAELREQGALTLDPPTETNRRLKGKKAETIAGSQAKPTSNEHDEDSEEDEVDIDYNLAKNLLESFKSQGGMAGPTGNLLGLMGIQLPRDEDDGDDENEGDTPGQLQRKGQQSS
ncbi:Protein ecdysoneless [Paramyrothecium foliicola]|nr:Protein ecdysoneless [Paramyrothecium foliicola]